MQTAHPEQIEPDERSGHLTPTEVASRLGVDPSTVRRHGARLGAKVFGRWRLDPAKVAEATSGGAA